MRAKGKMNDNKKKLSIEFSFILTGNNEGFFAVIMVSLCLWSIDKANLSVNKTVWDVDVLLYTLG